MTGPASDAALAPVRRPRADTARTADLTSWDAPGWAGLRVVVTGLGGGHEGRLAPRSPLQPLLGQLLGPLLAALSTHFAGGLQPALALAGLGLVFAGLLLRRPHSLSVAAGVAATARR